MRTTIILLLLFAISCKKNESKVNPPKLDSNQTAKVSVERKIDNGLMIPEGFTVDTIVLLDENKRLETKVIIPMSGIKELDNSVKKEIITKRDDFIEELTKRIKDDNGEMSQINSDFNAKLVSIFKSDKVISYCFIISDYFGGSSHPMDIYYSVNYDLKSRKRILFKDYFKVETKKDTLFFTQLITKTIKEESISVRNLNYIDFNIEKDSISFNYDDYEIASYAFGTIRAKISIEELKSQINNNYR